MQCSSAGIALAVSANATQGAESDFLPRSGDAMEERITNQIDVLVVGGGTAGTSAAIQSARAGARTLIIERGTQLGGTMITGGVAFPGLFDAWGKQIIAGIGWELVKESVELDGGTSPITNVLKPSPEPLRAGRTRICGLGTWRSLLTHDPGG